MLEYSLQSSMVIACTASHECACVRNGIRDAPVGRCWAVPVGNTVHADRVSVRLYASVRAHGCGCWLGLDHDALTVITDKRVTTIGPAVYTNTRTPVLGSNLNVPYGISSH